MAARIHLDGCTFFGFFHLKFFRNDFFRGSLFFWMKFVFFMEVCIFSRKLVFLKYYFTKKFVLFEEICTSNRLELRNFRKEITTEKIIRTKIN